MKQDETGLKRERIRNVEEVIFSVCTGKGWEASVSSQDEENWKYATISVTKYIGGGRINGTFEITLDDRFRMVPELIMDFNSILNDGGWKELTREVNVQVMKIPWLKTKAPIIKETQPVEAKSSKTITADKQPSKNAEKEDMVNIVEDPTKVFVVHGRNDNANKAIFSFLRSIGLKPLEWSQIIASMNVGSPYIGDILDCAFNQAQAVVVLLTPDDEARLRDSFRKPDEQEYEIKLTAQARPNVLFEAGMAFGRFPERTILVELGKLRPFSDITGRHTVKLDDSTQKRQDLAQRLRKAGCAVDITGTDWHTEGKFNEVLQSTLIADEPSDEAEDKRPSDDEFIILNKGSSLRPSAFLGDGRIDSITHLTIHFDFINNRDEITMLNEPKIISLKTNSDLLSNEPAAIRFNHLPTSIISWVFPYKFEKHSRDSMKCEIDLLITNIDPEYFAEKLNSLKSYEIEFQFSYEDMRASTSVKEIIINGTYDLYKEMVLNFWKEKKRTDLIKLLL